MQLLSELAARKAGHRKSDYTPPVRPDRTEHMEGNLMEEETGLRDNKAAERQLRYSSRSSLYMKTR